MEEVIPPILVSFRQQIGDIARPLGPPVCWVLPLPELNDLISFENEWLTVNNWKVVKVATRLEKTRYSTREFVAVIDRVATVYLESPRTMTHTVEPEAIHVETVHALRVPGGVLTEVHDSASIVKAFKYGGVLYESKEHADYAAMVAEVRSDLEQFLAPLLDAVVGKMKADTRQLALGSPSSQTALVAVLADLLVRDDMTEPAALTFALWRLHGRGAQAKPPRYS